MLPMPSGPGRPQVKLRLTELEMTRLFMNMGYYIPRSFILTHPRPKPDPEIRQPMPGQAKMLEYQKQEKGSMLRFKATAIKVVGGYHITCRQESAQQQGGAKRNKYKPSSQQQDEGMDQGRSKLLQDLERFAGKGVYIAL